MQMPKLTLPHADTALPKPSPPSLKTTVPHETIPARNYPPWSGATGGGGAEGGGTRGRGLRGGGGVDPPACQRNSQTDSAPYSHRANHYAVHPGTTPGNHPPTEGGMIHSEQGRGCRLQGPGPRGYRRWKTADLSHSARCAPEGAGKCFCITKVYLGDPSSNVTVQRYAHSHKSVANLCPQ